MQALMKMSRVLDDEQDCHTTTVALYGLLVLEDESTFHPAQSVLLLTTVHRDLHA